MIEVNINHRKGILKIKPLLSQVIKPEDSLEVYNALKNREKGYV